MSYIGKQPVVGNFQVCDAITVVNGQAAYTMQVSSANVEPENANHMLVSLNGILQKPGSSFTISGATITFASNLATGDVIDFIILLGNVLDIGTPSDGTVTNAKLAQDIISGETDIGGTIADADLFLLDDGAGGTLRKTAASRIKTYIGAGNNTPAFHARLSSGQSVSSGSEVKVTLDSEVVDSDGCYDPSTNYRFTPDEAGKYLIIHGMRGGISATRFVGWIRKNGATDHAIAETNPNSSGSNPANLGSCIIDFNGSSDYVEYYCYHTKGSNITLEATSNYDGTFFQGFKLIGV